MMGLSVRYGDELRFIATASVRSVIPPRPITLLNSVVSTVDGVVFYEGWVVPVHDVAKHAPGMQGPIVVCEVDGDLIALTGFSSLEFTARKPTTALFDLEGLVDSIRRTTWQTSTLVGVPSGTPDSKRTKENRHG